MFSSTTAVDHTTFIVIGFPNCRVSDTLPWVYHPAVHLDALVVKSGLFFDDSAMHW